MKNKLKALVAGLAAIVSFSSAQAAFDIDGWYVGASGSVGFHAKQKSKNTPTTTGAANAAARRLTFNVGGGGAVEVGMVFMENWRFSVEGSYRTNSVKKGSILLFTGDSGLYKASGSVNYMSLLFNAAYDIHAWENFVVSLGGGLGWTHATMKNVSANVSGITGNAIKKKSDNVFGWQLKAQLGYMIQENATVYVGYGLFSTSEPSYLTASGAKLKFEAPFLHSIDFGFRVHL